MAFVVYALQDPRDLSVRYVGMSAHHRRRIQHHRKDGNIHKRGWLNELQREDLWPVVLTLAAVDDRAEAARLEREWIARYRAEGAKLLNCTHGPIPRRQDYRRTAQIWRGEHFPDGDSAYCDVHPSAWSGED